MFEKKEGKFNAVVLLDVVGFALLFVGAALIRFSKDEIVSILGGFVLAGAVTVLTLTRLIVR